jgi:sigma-B regulation protein RsbU (phosphoserine phosphatase)
MMREMSMQTDPQEMVKAYASRVRRLLPSDRQIAVSCRGLDPPRYCITRSSIWKEAINPWKERHRLPVFDRGLLGELLYAGEPRIINHLVVPDDDPAAAHLAGLQSLLAIPQLDAGEARNMVVSGSREADAFDPEHLPELFWLSNLFGRAAHNLVLSEQVQAAYATVDQELKIVADIQRSLLPKIVPSVPTIDLAVHYQTSHRAGGDYYDFFSLPGGKLGILLADASGHGTPATVMMAITHSIAHSYSGPLSSPSELLSFVNRQLARGYTGDNDSFVTAFYGIYDPVSRSLQFANAGHNPPRLKHSGDGSLASLDAAAGLPLGVVGMERYREDTVKLNLGDTIVFYTDGVTEATGVTRPCFGVEGIDEVFREPSRSAGELLARLLRSLERFTNNRPPDDDRTVLVARIVS